MGSEPSMDSLASLLGGLVAAFQAEREKDTAFKDLFGVGSSFSGLLRALEGLGMTATLDACTVLEKRHGVWISDPVLDFLLAVPFLARRLEKQIQDASGPSCCADKAFALLSEELQRLIEANPRPSGEDTGVAEPVG